jgi:hypothetical protein
MLYGFSAETYYVSLYLSLIKAEGAPNDAPPWNAACNFTTDGPHLRSPDMMIVL